MKILKIEKVEIARQDSMPDVDADFPVAFRDTVKEYMSKRYGVNHVCSVGTYTRMKLKTCLKDFGKVMGVPFAVMNKLTKDIDDQIEYTWGDLFNYAATSRELFRFVQDHPELVHMTKYALTQCKTSSIHPSAVIVVPQEDEDGNPIDLFGWMPMKKMGDVLVSEWEGKYIDKSGFLKEDILGLNQLDKFSSIIKLIAKNRREQIDVNTIPFNDEEVYRYFQRGWCEDVFQFGAMGLMNYCREAKPQSLDDLIAMTALFRPGPMDVKAHETFVEIKNGARKPKFDPGMEEITRDTYSLYTYQEQIMKAMVVGGLTPVESDECRTYIKKKNHEALAQFKGKFVNGYSALIESRGVESKRAAAQASEVWDKMLAFASYGFNKCLAGSERIRRVGITRGSYAPTIEEMYEIKNRTSDLWLSHESLSDKYIRSGYGMCWSLNDEGRLVRNKIVDIRFEGVRPVYEITVRSGEKIRCTSNHRFPTPAGEMSIDSGLAVGARLYIWAGYEETNKDYSFQRGRSQNYPTKGQCGFQRQEYHPTVDFENFKRQHAGCPCDKCGKVGKRMEAHHMDGNRANNDVSNLMWLCNSCHKKIHFETLPRHRMGEKGLLTRLEEIVNIQCVGEEKVYDVEVSGNVSHTFLTDGGVVTCNSHAVAYTMMSYWSQWFKVNYPLEFWTTSLQYASKESDIPYRLVEMKKTGAEIEVRPPDINFSGETFTCDPKTNRIFFSLGKVKGVGERALTLLKAMKDEHGEVFSFEDFITSAPKGINRTVVLRLIMAGAFDLVEDIRNPRQRLDIVKQYLERRGEPLSDEFTSPDARTNAWWVFKQRELTGYGEVDYERMMNEYGLGKRMVRLYVTAAEFERKRDFAVHAVVVGQQQAALLDLPCLDVLAGAAALGLRRPAEQHGHLHAVADREVNAQFFNKVVDNIAAIERDLLRKLRLIAGDLLDGRFHRDVVHAFRLRVKREVKDRGFVDALPRRHPIAADRFRRVHKRDHLIFRNLLFRQVKSSFHIVDGEGDHVLRRVFVLRGHIADALFQHPDALHDASIREIRECSVVVLPTHPLDDALHIVHHGDVAVVVGGEGDGQKSDQLEGVAPPLAAVDVVLQQRVAGGGDSRVAVVGAGKVEKELCNGCTAREPFPERVMDALSH